MIDELEQALEAFARDRRRLESALNISHRLPEPVRAEVSASGLDVQHSVRLLADIQGVAVRDLLTEMRALGTPRHIPPEAATWTEKQHADWWRENPPPEPDWAALDQLAAAQQSGASSSARLGVAYKAVFIFVRAYQDALARVVLYADGRLGGKRTSVTQLLKRENAFSALVDQRLADYRRWFRRWARLRDQAKVGVGFAITMAQGELGVVFTGVPDEGSPIRDLATHQSIYLSDATEALQVTTRLTVLVTEAVGERMTATERAAIRAD